MCTPVADRWTAAQRVRAAEAVCTTTTTGTERLGILRLRRQAEDGTSGFS